MGQPRQLQVCTCASPKQSVEASTVIWGVKIGLQVHLDLLALCLILVDVCFLSICGDTRTSYERLRKLFNFQVSALSEPMSGYLIDQTENCWGWWFLTSHPVIPTMVTSTIRVTGEKLGAVASWSDRPEPIMWALSRGIQSHGLHRQFRSLSIHVEKLSNL